MTVYFPQKIGFYTLRKIAYSLCKAIDQFGPLIKYYFPNSTALHTLLETIHPLCSQLVTEIDNVRKSTFPP